MAISKTIPILIALAALVACVPAPEPEPEPEPVIAGPAPTKYLTTKPYKNKAGSPVIVRSGPEADAPQIGTLAKGDSAMVQTCESTETRCQIVFGEFGATGWVDMGGLSL
jgi:hypothetical protein